MVFYLEKGKKALVEYHHTLLWGIAIGWGAKGFGVSYRCCVHTLPYLTKVQIALLSLSLSAFCKSFSMFH